VDVRDKTGLAPIHHAIVQEREDILDLLLTSGADPDCPAELTGETPLFLACMKSDAKTSEKLARTLFSHGADITAGAVTLAGGPFHWSS
jgi:ankyrin repeat protein